MRRVRRPLWLLTMAAAVFATGCEREARRFSVAPSQPGASAARLGALQPGMHQEGGVQLGLVKQAPYEENAFGVNQGKRLFRWYNCNGCHSQGGGGIGPALMDAEWKYGSDPNSIYTSIVQGRPEGMPSFGGHIPDDQVWQIVSYVRSMSGQLRKDVEPSRSDALSGGEPENARNRETMRPAPPPPKPAMGASQ